MTGALSGVRIIEMAGVGPAPFCAMMLADHGADVIRIDRPGGVAAGVDPQLDILNRSRRSIIADLKTPEGVQLVRDLVADADGLIEGFRPSVMERLGLGPEVLLKDNPRLVYGRMTGWGQDGPYAQLPGHDINYIALAGALSCFGPAGEKPHPPINIVGDFGGGAMMLAFGMVSAILNARASGEGQVVDCAMTDGASALMAMIWSFANAGAWSEQRGVNLLDGGAPFYNTYETADGKYISVGALEPQFYREFTNLLGLDQVPGYGGQHDQEKWPAQGEIVAARVRTKTRDEWCSLMEARQICFAPVLTMKEAAEHPHNRHRGTFLAQGDSYQPAPAPRFSATPPAKPLSPPRPGHHAAEILAELGYDKRRAGPILALAGEVSFP